MRVLTIQTLQQLRQNLKSLARADRKLARRLLDQKESLLKRVHSITEIRATGLRIRCHGDYQLGQVLWTGNDFVIIDFEGEPSRSITERRIKRTPIRDVAGMLRSFYYAAFTSLYGKTTPRGSSPGIIRSKDIEYLAPWARFWYGWVGSTFVRTYLETVKNAFWMPKSQDEIMFFLNLYLLEKAIYELRYELNHRPDWVTIPLRGVLELLETTA
jgi:maltose alpha-D-glucosyltransferase/alpha-amylase